MKRFCLLTFLALGMMLRPAATLAQSTQATEAPKAADCLATAENAAVSAQYGGKTYYFTSQACKDQFLTDPERYSQLYDALLELKAEGQPLPKPLDNASAVPS